ncbi:MAG: hypothetical protein ACOYT4_03330 [Nanoarchaeota archaeon]
MAKKNRETRKLNHSVRKNREVKNFNYPSFDVTRHQNKHLPGYIEEISREREVLKLWVNDQHLEVPYDPEKLERLKPQIYELVDVLFVKGLRYGYQYGPKFVFNYQGELMSPSKVENINRPLDLILENLVK